MIERPRYALLHATYHRPSGPLEVRDAWMALAEHPDQVEYIFALDHDDELSRRATEGCVRVVSPAQPNVTAVRNWNAAAASSAADVLVVVADDLFPLPGWDTALTEVIGPLDPRTQPFAVKVNDGRGGRDVLMRHPVISRAFYERHGLFSPAFQGVFCDDDITRRAFWRSFIVDGRSITLDHRHALFDGSATLSSSQSRINATDEYTLGAAAYEALWSRHHRRASIRLVQPSAIRNGSPGEVRMHRLRQLTAAHIESFFKAGRTAATLGPGRLTRRIGEPLGLAPRPGDVRRRPRA